MVIYRTTALQLPGIYWCGQLSRNLPKCLPGHPDAHIKSSSKVLHGKTFRLEWNETEKRVTSGQTNRQMQWVKKHIFGKILFLWVKMFFKVGFSVFAAPLAPSLVALFSHLFLSTRLCLSHTQLARCVGELVGVLFCVCRVCVRVRLQAYFQVLYISRF